MREKKPPLVRETVALYEAKTHLSSLVERADEGAEIVISKSGKPKARLVPLGDWMVALDRSWGWRRVGGVEDRGRCADGS